MPLTEMYDDNEKKVQKIVFFFSRIYGLRRKEEVSRKQKREIEEKEMSDKVTC